MRRTWPLWGWLGLALTACAATPSVSTATPSLVPLVTATPPAVDLRDESFWLESREGTVIVELQLLNLAEPEAAPNGRWAFRVALTESVMDAPPLTEVYNLARLTYLSGPNGEQISPLGWTLEEEGHMGHHVKGILTFPEEEQTKTIKVVIHEVGGVSERVFEWSWTP